MKDKLKNCGKLLILFILGGLIYMGMEMLFRGRTHWTMGIVGGICFLIIGGLNNYYTWDMSIIKQGVIGSLVITAMELVTGIILNLFLKLNIWDYSTMPFNILGQICLPFTLLWIPVSIFGVFVDDFLRWLLFKEPFPHYRLFSKKD